MHLGERKGVGSGRKKQLANSVSKRLFVKGGLPDTGGEV